MNSSSHAVVDRRCRVRGVRTREIANALLPQFPGEGEHDRTDDQPDESEHLEAAKGAHQHPDEAQANPSSRATMGRTILSPQNRTKQPSPNESNGGAVAAVIASFKVNAATAT